MGRSDNVIDYIVNIKAQLNNFSTGVQKVKSELNKLHLEDNIDNEFKDIFSKLDKEIKNLQTKAQNKVQLVDEKTVKESFDKINNLYDGLIKKLKSNKVQTSLLEEDAKFLKTLTTEASKYVKTISKAGGPVDTANKAYEDQLVKIKQLEEIKRRAEKIELNAINNQQKAQKILDDTETNKAQKEIEKANRSEKIAETKLNKAKKELAEAKAAKDELEEKHKAKFLETHDNLRGWNSQWKSYTKSSDEYAQSIQRIAIAESDVATKQQKFNLAEQNSLSIRTKAAAIISDERELYEKNSAALNGAIEKVKKASAGVAVATSNYTTAQNNLKQFKATLDQFKNVEFQPIKQALDALDWSKISGGKVNIQTYDELIKYIDKLTQTSNKAAVSLIQQLNPALSQIKTSGQQAKSGFDQSFLGVKKLVSVQSDLERLTSRLVQFFSIDNAVRLFKRAVRSAMSTVQDLDKVMTETAVVTDFTVGDMWKQLPQYTERANELGLAVKDVYEASTLYYQQGLQTNEVMSVTNATLRMARIASLDASEATDRMTNALRGFNMEINETNANNIADVYSKLAAISASDVDEISTAMTKVASLANSANMQFENTAAFLAQIIETTRESAETAGTALKTVVARFSEVKELYSKGELLGTDEEGEEVDVNKVSKALRTAGINLNEFLTGQRGLDEIFMELASKWDSLDIVQQRYIATMAAGSRQQSRFIALMSDYQRTQELTAAAQNANGASMEQYNKTLESVETKINRLKNAWNEFLMGIANDQAIRFVLDSLIKFLSGINKITDAISGGKGLLKSIANIGITVGGLKIGGSIIGKILGNPKTATTGWVQKLLVSLKGSKQQFSTAGASIGKTFWGSVTTSINNTSSINLSGGISSLKNNFIHQFQNTFGSTLSAQDLGLTSIDLSNVDFKINSQIDFNSVRRMSLKNNDWSQISLQQKQALGQLNQELKAGIITQDEYIQSVKQNGIAMNITGEQAESLGLKFKNEAQSLHITSAAMMGLGATLTGLGAIIEKVTGKSTPFTKTLKVMGTALMAFGAILPIVSTAFKKFGIDVSTTIMNIPIIGWIAAIITAIIGLITLLTEVIETPAEAAKRAREELEASTEASNKATEAVNNLSSSYDKLLEKADALKELRKGTAEWKKAVADNNKEVLKLLQTYKELKIESKDGILTITNYDEVLADYQQREINSQITVMGKSITAAQADLASSIENIRQQTLIGYDYKTSYQYKNGTVEEVIKHKNFGDDVYKEIARQFAEGASSEQVNKYLQSLIYNNDTLTGVTDSVIASFIALNDEINETNTQLEAQYQAIGANVASNINLSEEQQKYVDELSSNTESIEKLYSQYSNETTEKYRNEDQETKDLYKEFISETYGAHYGNVIDKKGNFKDSSGNSVEYNKMKDAFNAWRVANKSFNTQVEKSAVYLEKLSNSVNEADRAIAKSYEGNNGSNLTMSEILTLFEDQSVLENFDLTKINTEGTDEYDWLWNIWNKDENLRNAFNDDFESWATQFATNITSAYDAFEKGYATFDSAEFKEATKKFGSETVAALTHQLAEYRPSDNGQFGTQIINELENLLNTDVTGDFDKLEKVINSFSTVALNSEDDLQNFKAVLSDMGIEVAEKDFNTFIKNITEGMAIISNIDLEQLTASVENLTKVASDINEGKQDRVFSSNIYDQLKEAGVNNDFLSNFVNRSDGSYLYIGDKLDEVVSAINQQTNDLLGKGRKQLETKQAAWNLTKDTIGIGNKFYYIDPVSGSLITDTKTNKEWLYEVITNFQKNGFNIGNLGINGLYGNLDWSHIVGLDNTTVDSWITQIKEIAANEAHWKEELNDLNKIEGNSKLMKKTIQQLNAEFTNDIIATGQISQEMYDRYGGTIARREFTDEEKENYRSAMLSKASEIVPTDILEQYINRDFTDEVANELTNLTSLYSGLEEKELEANQVSKLAQTLQLSMGGTLSDATSKAIELLGAMDTKEVKQEDVEAFAQKIAETTETDMASAMRIAIDTLAMNGEGIIPQEVMDQFLEQGFNLPIFDSLLGSYQEAQDLNFDVEQVQELTKYLQETKDLSLQAATAVAVASKKHNDGLDKLIGSYEEINNLIEKGPLGKGQKLVFADSKQFEQFSTLKKNLKESLHLSADLSDSFFESGENIGNLSKLVNGSVDEQKTALWELQKAASIDLAINSGLAEDEVNQFIQYLSLIPIPDLEVGATINNEQFIAALNYLMSVSEDAGAAIAQALGVEQQFEQVGTQRIAYLDRDAELSGGNPVRYTEVPIYKEKWVSTGSGHADFSSLGGGGGRNAKDSGSGSGSKESKPKLWKNPYDELYNLQEKVNDALREREQLEHRYEDMLKDHTKTSADLVENTYAEVAALKQQLQLNKQLLAGRKDQMSRVGNEMFEDSEGNRTTLAATGATKYGWYDESTGVVQIDYDAIDKITDENLGDAVSQYISRLEEIRDQINDTEDTIEDINDQLIEIQDRGKEEYLGLEDKVYEAVVSSREKEIEELEEINSSVSDAANKTISAIQDEISKERQARENEETEQNILDKEMRLAYLQRDTSGANDLEIQKLQEEIANDQQSYQDKIIDQTIQEMQDEAERAAEQRQAQIDLLNWQLEVDQKTGAIWQTVSELLTGAFDKDGNLDTGSSLYKLLYNNESAMSQFGKEKWKQDLAREIANAMQGRQNWELSTAKENGSLTLGDGTKLKYNKERDAWWDEKNKRFLTDSDLVWDQNTLSYTMPSTTKGTSIVKPQTKADEETKNDNTSKTVSYTVQRGDGWWQVAQAVYGSAEAANQQQEDVYQQLLSQGITELHPGQVVKIIKRYATGGLVNSTGPAWLDGTKSRPEMVLNAADTQNFITLKNILASILNNTQSNSKPAAGGDNYFDIDIQAEIDSDYDVDRLADRIKQQIAEDASYRNVNMISQMR